MIANRRTIRNITFTISAAVIFFGCGDSGSSDPDTSAQPKAAGSDATAAAPTEATMPAGGYAPKLVMPKKRPEHVEVPLAEMFLASAQVPAAADVNIPQYPGARILSTMPAAQFESSSGDGKTLSGMIVLSSDEVDTVLAFYKDSLAGWQYKDFYGVHTFWDGPEGSNPLDVTAGHSTLSLTAIEEGDVLRLLWPEVRTKIDMMYDKPGS